jgi:hypothetical protein
VVKGPAADATDAPQPRGLLCSPVMKTISFFRFSLSWSTDGMKLTGKTKVVGEKSVLVPLCPPQIPHGQTRGSSPGLRGERPATNHLSHGTAVNVSNILFKFRVEVKIFKIVLLQMYTFSHSDTQSSIHPLDEQLIRSPAEMNKQANKQTNQTNKTK